MLTIDLPTGVSLEADLKPPGSQNTHGNKLAILLHPWSWLGGNMSDPVLQLISRPLLERGYHVLRFNSRGVGRSTGWSSFTGMSEGQDLQAIVSWALGTIPNVRTVVIAGYSHGSLIATLQPVLPPPIKTSHILLSYPLGARSLLTLYRTSEYTSALNALIHNPTSNILIIYGTTDEFTAVANYDTWIKTLRTEAEREGRGHLEVLKVTGATHFWHDEKGKELGRAIQNWLS